MNKTFTCLAILALTLFADALSIKQTIEFRDLLANSSVAILLTAEGIFAGIAVASSISLLRKRFARQKKPFSRRPISEAARA